jgi:hypothetical protein
MRNQEEHRLQVSICKWLDLTQNFPFFSVPNGGKRNIVVAVKLKMEGVKAGVADMFWMISNDNWNGLFVEVKTAKGVKSADQRAFEKLAIAHGYYYAVVRSIDDCIELLNKYKLNQI